ncbi:hypothetical protein K7432_009850 [Basidiobolus ranarum]|uniref:Uncharacterized protein n=1 Tax=Basidiobolus ranarum TaxID=34480 RepID=A0ABR2WPQ5_9FUNG
MGARDTTDKHKYENRVKHPQRPSTDMPVTVETSSGTNHPQQIIELPELDINERPKYSASNQQDKSKDPQNDITTQYKTKRPESSAKDSHTQVKRPRVEMETELEKSKKLKDSVAHLDEKKSKDSRKDVSDQYRAGHSSPSGVEHQPRKSYTPEKKPRIESQLKSNQHQRYENKFKDSRSDNIDKHTIKRPESSGKQPKESDVQSKESVNTRNKDHRSIYPERRNAAIEEKGMRRSYKSVNKKSKEKYPSIFDYPEYFEGTPLLIEKPNYELEYGSLLTNVHTNNEGSRKRSAPSSPRLDSRKVKTQRTDHRSDRHSAHYHEPHRKGTEGKAVGKDRPASLDKSPAHKSNPPSPSQKVEAKPQEAQQKPAEVYSLDHLLNLVSK